ncbi:MAG: nucleotidyl transferase AbiEii/AbiGii toxin family protein [Clostridiales bacterium]|nr:nucleotidyl transferase AbiEii/AbiGii toxin family protein [Clostridiales bacterium]
MSLKAKIRNVARKKNMSAQVVLQNYMFERFLERLSKSEYKDKFILKGGILIASIIGIESRSTMDMDTTVKDYPITHESLEKAMSDICEIDLRDDVIFSFSGVDPIRNDDVYGGFKVSIQADYDTIITPMHLDITTGDAITPEEVLHHYKMIFNEETIDVWAYNIETILAEKVETIISRGELNTRPRDFYDVYILTHTQSYNNTIFFNALTKTAEHRETTHIFNEISNRVETIKNSVALKNRWTKYTKSYPYAKDITYMEVINALKILVNS